MKEVENKPMHGSPPDEKLDESPMEERQCRDLICCLLWIGGTIAFIIIISIGFREGQPLRLSYAYDPDGRACGHDAGVIDAPYIYMVAPYVGFFNRSTCVQQCPNYLNESVKPKQLQCVTNKVIQNCSEFISFDGVNDATNISSILTVNFEDYSVKNLFNYSRFIYNSTDLLDRVCIPAGQKYIDIILDKIDTVIDFSTVDSWISDIELTYPIIIASAGIAIAIALFYLILMRYCAGLLTWLAILLYFVCLVIFIIYLRSQALIYKDWADQNTKNGISDKNNNDLQTYYALIGFFITMIAIAGLSVFSFICYFQRIRMAIAVVKSAAVFVVETPSVILVPPVFIVITMGFWALWIVSFVYVYSTGTIITNPSTPFASVQWSENIRYYLVYHLFYGLWTNATIQAMSLFIISSSCCLWFYYQGDGQLIHAPVLDSVYRLFRYHFGSMVFGGFLLAVVQFVRFWLEYIHYQMKQAGADQQQPLKCLMDCCRCYAACFERFVAFINKNAYIQIALTGENFIVAAKNGFHLVWNNAGQYAIVSGIGGIFCFLCKIFVAAATTLICYLIITKSETYSQKLQSPIMPSILFFIIAYTLGNLFMQIYGMSIDSILVCAITEEEVCKRKNGKAPKHCPAPIKEFLYQYKKN